MLDCIWTGERERWGPAPQAGVLSSSRPLATSPVLAKDRCRNVVRRSALGVVLQHLGDHLLRLFNVPRFPGVINLVRCRVTRRGLRRGAGDTGCGGE